MSTCVKEKHDHYYFHISICNWPSRDRTADDWSHKSLTKMGPKTVNSSSLWLYIQFQKAPGKMETSQMMKWPNLEHLWFPCFKRTETLYDWSNVKEIKSMRPNRQTDAEPWVRYTGPDHLKDLERDVGLNRGDLLKQAKTGLEPHSRRSNRVVLRRQPLGELMDEEACRNSPWGDKNQVFAR